MEPWLCHSNTLTGVFFVKGEAMLDIKRIRTDFDAVAKKLATRVGEHRANLALNQKLTGI